MVPLARVDPDEGLVYEWPPQHVPSDYYAYRTEEDLAQLHTKAEVFMKMMAEDGVAEAFVWCAYWRPVGQHRWPRPTASHRHRLRDFRETFSMFGSQRGPAFDELLRSGARLGSRTCQLHLAQWLMWRGRDNNEVLELFNEALRGVDDLRQMPQTCLSLVMLLRHGTGLNGDGIPPPEMVIHRIVSNPGGWKLQDHGPINGGGGSSVVNRARALSILEKLCVQDRQTPGGNPRRVRIESRWYTYAQRMRRELQENGVVAEV
jgi:hypothetical protein